MQSVDLVEGGQVDVALDLPTVKKCRATSSMVPRQAKRGESWTLTPGIVQGPGSTVGDSTAAGRSWRSVCTPRNRPAAEPASRRTDAFVTARRYASPFSWRDRAREMTSWPPPLVVTGRGKPVERRRIAAR